MQIPNNYIKYSRLICIVKKKKSQEKGKLKYIIPIPYYAFFRASDSNKFQGKQ